MAQSKTKDEVIQENITKQEDSSAKVAELKVGF
jgi:hypothetical protein